VIVTERFHLEPAVKAALRAQVPRFGFGLLGEAIYARTYSRTMADGRQETWPDTVIRVVEGVGSIRKDWYVRHGLPWDEAAWQEHLRRMAFAIFAHRFLPPGRGLWAMGTDYVYQRGGMALNNCAYVDVATLSTDLAWIMNGLMAGVGVGFSTTSFTGELRHPQGETVMYVVPDDREGWVESLRRLIHSYEAGSSPLCFDYSQIRAAGAPIRGFGGTASGYQPLAKLHERTRSYLDAFVCGRTSRTRLVADLTNAVGACVVAGNVRRSAEVAIGSPHDTEFLDLKNYGTPDAPGPAFDRMDIGWLSNNTVRLEQHEDFEQLPELAERIRVNGEPGVMNLINVQKYGRYAEESPDRATGTNPCAEIALEDKEICCLVEVFPTRCATDAEYFEALELAQIYAHTASLLPTDSPATNAVVARNHRMGQSLSGIADWYESRGATAIVTLQRQGYRLVQAVNERLAAAAGVPKSVRLTTVKPSGTVSQLAGVSPGMHYPLYTTFIRRVRIGRDSLLVPLLHEAGVPSEPDIASDRTLVLEFPVTSGAKRTQRDLSMWQKGMMVASLQRHWADNAVSNTISFNPVTEGHQIEDFLANLVPFTKTISMLPDTDAGAYPQMPYEPISDAEYARRAAAIRPIDWSRFGDSDGEDSVFCTACEA
jgi:ribonucleoside-diphosphate reductase alpha chain